MYAALIDEQAEHHAIAAAMLFAEHERAERVERLNGERRKEERLSALAQ